MTNQKLIDYLRKELRKGISEKDIKLKLLQNKWPKSEIESSLQIVKKESEKNDETEKTNFNYKNFFAVIIICLLFAGGTYYAYEKIQALTYEKQQAEARANEYEQQKQLAELSSQTEQAKRYQAEQELKKETELRTVAEIQAQQEEIERQQAQEEKSAIEKQLQIEEEEKSAIEKQLQIEQILSIGNTLQQVYSEMRSEQAFLSNKWVASASQLDQVAFASYLASHDSGQSYTYPEKYSDAYFAITGNYPWTDAKNKLETVLAYSGISIHTTNKASILYDSDKEKITKILSFINNNLHYEYDINNVLRAPSETLGLKSGDCDDYSTLAAALFELIGIPSAIQFVKNEDGTKYHAMVLIQSEESLPLYSYSDLSHLLTQYLVADEGWGVRKVSEGSWYIIEPQWTFDKQQDSSIKEWIITVISEVEPMS